MKVSMKKDAAGVIKIGSNRVEGPVFIATGSPIASLFNTFKGCVCSRSVRLSRIRRMVLAKMKDSCVRRPLCNLPATHASRFVTGNLDTRCTAKLSQVVIIDVKANASFIGIRRRGVHRMNKVNVKKNALVKLSHLLLRARSVL